MMREEEGRPAPKPIHTLGEALDTFSVEELEARIASLQEEIERIEAEVAAKRHTRAAADAFFKR